MIAALDGVVIHKKKDTLIILAGCVGYLVHMSQKWIEEITNQDKLRIFTYTHVREDKWELFGFKTLHELEVFELLLSVSGIGPKTALGILERGEHLLLEAIEQRNLDFFKGIPRVGTKNAQKIIIELASKVSNTDFLSNSPKSQEVDDLVITLKTMGFSQAESITAVKSLSVRSGSFNEKLREALKLLDQKKNNNI